MNGPMIYRTENMAENNLHTRVDMTTKAMQLGLRLVFISGFTSGLRYRGW